MPPEELGRVRDVQDAMAHLTDWSVRYFAERVPDGQEMFDVRQLSDTLCALLYSDLDTNWREVLLFYVSTSGYAVRVMTMRFSEPWPILQHAIIEVTDSGEVSTSLHEPTDDGGSREIGCWVSNNLQVEAFRQELEKLFLGINDTVRVKLSWRPWSAQCSYTLPRFRWRRWQWLTRHVARISTDVESRTLVITQVAPWASDYLQSRIPAIAERMGYSYMFIA